MNTTFKEKIETLKAEAQNLQAKNAEELEQLRQKYLSKKGAVTALFDEFKLFPKEEKAQWGASINQLKQQVESRISELRDAVTVHCASSTVNLDLTRTPDPIAMGTRHPLSLVREQIIDIFSRIGFTVADGPEVEDDKHVFGMLNFAPEHPARDMQDTFFIEKEEGVQKPTDILLRTHTSSVQTRVMTQWAKQLADSSTHQVPDSLRVLCPGRVFRNEAISARAHCFFHQVEGLYIDKNVSFADLRQVLLYFAKEMFGPETQIRLRPSYFPFTEPSAEM
ncbi:MAG: phenylalanine--tRNA ligase subunit alpha, partial [Paludibacteraceae bacterium]|nr:phenylalanine--tRNA ligase subunit alpha [Paludibacteraceae bacterium]